MQLFSKQINNNNKLMKNNILKKTRFIDSNEINSGISSYLIKKSLKDTFFNNNNF